MKRLGVLTWFLGPNGTRRLSQDYTIKVDAYLLYLMKHQLYQILYGRLQRALLQIATPRFCGACSVTLPVTLGGSVNAFLASATPGNGRRNKLIVVRYRLPIRGRSNRGSMPTVRTVTLYASEFGAYSQGLVRWNSSHRKMSREQQPPMRPRLNPTIRW